VSFDIRPVTGDEFIPFSRAADAAFGHQPTTEQMEGWRAIFEPDRSLAAFDDGRIVGTAGAVSFALTLPGLTTLPVAGVTAVGVLPTHRRQGILTSVMRRQLEDVRARGEALAILYASESAIYGRFGYGLATSMSAFDLDRRHAAFARPVESPGRCRLLDRDEALDTLPAAYDRARRVQPGAVTRSAAWWTGLLRDPESEREGASAYWYVVYESADGQVDGFAHYRVKGQWDDGLSNNTLLLSELSAATSEAHAVLWRYLLDVDLVTTVRAANAPVDEPLRWLLADPRRMRVTRFNDGVWVRVLDVSAALSARRYAVSGRLALDLADPFLPRNSGRYLLEGGPEGAACGATTEAADLALGVSDLAAILLGGARPSTLARAGRIVERSPGALARADLMFACEPLPWCGTFF